MWWVEWHRQHIETIQALSLVGHGKLRTSKASAVEAGGGVLVEVRAGRPSVRVVVGSVVAVSYHGEVLLGPRQCIAANKRGSVVIVFVFVFPAYRSVSGQCHAGIVPVGVL